MTDSHFEALAFGPGWPASGERVGVVLRAASLVLTDSRRRDHEVAYSRLAVRVGGWDADGARIEWSDEGAAFALAVHGEALKSLRERAPEALRARNAALLRPRRRSAVPRSIATAVAGVLGVAALALFLFFTQFDRVVDAAVKRIPPAVEEQIGAATATAIQAASPRLPDGAAARMIADLGARLAARIESPYAFHWILVESNEVNAMAAPGGWVIVFAGLVRAAESPEEVAGVLAHEVQHVVLRHSLRAAVRDLGWRATLGLVVGSSSDLGAVSAIAGQLGTLRFSRQQEAEADERGVELLIRAGIDPRGLATFFERLDRATGRVPAFLSTHPSSVDRARRVREWAGGFTAAAPLGYDWSAVQADLNRAPGARPGS